MKLFINPDHIYSEPHESVELEHIRLKKRAHEFLDAFYKFDQDKSFVQEAYQNFSEEIYNKDFWFFGMMPSLQERALLSDSLKNSIDFVVSALGRTTDQGYAFNLFISVLKTQMFPERYKNM